MAISSPCGLEQRYPALIRQAQAWNLDMVSGSRFLCQSAAENQNNYTADQIGWYLRHLDDKIPALVLLHLKQAIRLSEYIGAYQLVRVFRPSNLVVHRPRFQLLRELGPHLVP